MWSFFPFSSESPVFPPFSFPDFLVAFGHFSLLWSFVHPYAHSNPPRFVVLLPLPQFFVLSPAFEAFFFFSCFLPFKFVRVLFQGAITANSLLCRHLRFFSLFPNIPVFNNLRSSPRRLTMFKLLRGVQILFVPSSCPPLFFLETFFFFSSFDRFFGFPHELRFPLFSESSPLRSTSTSFFIFRFPLSTVFTGFLVFPFFWENRPESASR